MEKYPYLETYNRIGFTHLQREVGCSLERLHKKQKGARKRLPVPAKGLLAPLPKSRLEKLQRKTGIPGINNNSNKA